MPSLRASAPKSTPSRRRQRSRRQRARELACTSRTEGQPSYRMMFEYATTLPKGDVVVLGNADTCSTTRRSRSSRRGCRLRACSPSARAAEAARRGVVRGADEPHGAAHGVYPCGVVHWWRGRELGRPRGGSRSAGCRSPIELESCCRTVGVMNSVHAENRAGRGSRIMANVTSGGMIYNPAARPGAPRDFPRGAEDARVAISTGISASMLLHNDLQRAIAAGAACRRMAPAVVRPGGSVMCPTVDECTRRGDGAATPYAGRPRRGSSW